jgi:predicted NAD-dependent protein-ADP-ribosyltransferase YbiA (DUF1768 family)
MNLSKNSIFYFKLKMTMGNGCFAAFVTIAHPCRGGDWPEAE